MRDRRIRRLGILGDIHGEAVGLAKAIEFLRSNGRADCIVSVGDIVDGRGSVDDCCDLLIKEGVLAVRGNHDRWMLKGYMRSLRFATDLHALKRRSRDFLRSLPTTRVLTASTGVVSLAHGVGNDDMRALPPSPTKHLASVLSACHVVPETTVAIISGHSHRRGGIRRGNITFIAAGTLLAPRPCVSILDCDDGEISFHDI
jgi:predicted phosphodiesterase